MNRFYDAVVVGARCAGAATAMLMARRGLRVLVVDRAAYGTDALSTHALMRPAVTQLSRWGLVERLVSEGTPAIRATTFHYGPRSLTVDISPRPHAPALFAPRRTVLDRLLVDEARRAGAEVRHGIRVTDIVRWADGRVAGVVTKDHEGREQQIFAGIVIGADGMRSKIASLVSAVTYRRAGHSAAVIYGYWPGLGVDQSHWYYAENAAAGAIPTNDGLTCVFVAAPSERFDEQVRQDVDAGFALLLAEASPTLATSLPREGRLRRLYGFHGERGFYRQAWGPGWALVGDAGYFRDPLTAHGISDALRDAELLADAVVHGGDEALQGYQDARDDLTREHFRMSDYIASFAWNLEEIQAVHLDMARDMNRECDALLALDGGFAPAAGARSVAS